MSNGVGGLNTRYYIYLANSRKNRYCVYANWQLAAKHLTLCEYGTFLNILTHI